MATMECPRTPTRELRSRSSPSFLQDILQQERLHAQSKKPRRTKFVLETDAKIQSISDSVNKIRKRVGGIHTDFKSLEGKINRLDVMKEQACFFMSPKRVLSAAAEGMMMMSRRSPMKLTYYSPPTEYSSDQGYSSPTQDKLVEFMRRRKLAAVHLVKMWSRLSNERKGLDELFQSNMNTLRFKRAEKSLIKIIGLQSRVKIIGKELEGLQERLFSEQSFDEDSSYNVSR